ncbi:NlpC/P60 family protein [Rhodovulum sp. DZ06]|uniref:C40 family peptidase n=1 Tax=Rhodovulum sp. DZ06 TaxID=3425126 RepID=UPI003D34473D
MPDAALPDAPDPRRTLARPDLADAALKGRVEATAWVEPEPAEIRVGLAPLRGRPDAPGLAAQLRLGDRVRVAERRGGMAWVQRLRDSYVGWTPEAALTAPGPAPTHRVAAPLAHLYPGPDIKTDPADVAPMGALLAGEEAEGFLRTSRGFAPLSGLLRLDGGAPSPAAPPARPTPAEAAQALLGAPYLWGGESALGVDCSGLVQLAFEAAGIAAPRDSDMQAAELGAALENPWAGGDAAAPVPELIAGDLVFWRGHVGMMADPRTLVHANGFHMRVAAEPLAQAVARIAASTGGAGRGAGLPTALRRV